MKGETMIKNKKECVALICIAIFMSLAGWYAHKKEYKFTKKRADLLDELSSYKEDSELLDDQNKIFFKTGTYYISIDKLGNVLDVSNLFLDELGYTKNDLVGQNLTLLLRADWKQKTLLKFKKAMNKKSGEYFSNQRDITLVRKDGSFLKLTMLFRVKPDVGGVAFCWEREKFD